MQQRFFRILMLIMIIIIHGIAFLQFNLQISSLPLPDLWRGQFFFLLILSLLIALWLSFAFNKFTKCNKGRFFTWLLLGFHSLIICVMGIPLGAYLGVKLTLSMILIIEAFEYTALRDGLIFSVALLGITLGTQYLPIKAWQVDLQTASANDLLSFAIYDSIIIVLNLIVRFQQDSQIAATEIRKTYQEIVFQLGQVNMQLQEYAATVEQETLLNERKRLLREIHDTVAYTLTNLVMMLEAAKYMLKHSGNQLGEHLEQTRAQANNGLTEIHRVLQDLQPIPFSRTSGLYAIQQLVTTFAKATRIAVDLNLGNAPLNFGDNQELVAYRFVQEGITNALRHGRATWISISFSLFNQAIHILIEDNGIGADEPAEGYGLAGMRERIERLGGTLRISSNPGSGFRLLATIPMKGVR